MKSLLFQKYTINNMNLLIEQPKEKESLWEME